MDKPYAGGRWSESRYKSFIRSALRRAWMRWPVKTDVKQAARRKSQNANSRLKWEYQCACCKRWWAGADVNVDHIRECGGMDDMNRFIGTLFCEADNLRVVCLGCHRAKEIEE